MGTLSGLLAALLVRRCGMYFPLWGPYKRMASPMAEYVEIYKL
jgi:hypothetical protein